MEGTPDHRAVSKDCNSEALIDLGKSATTIAHRWLFVLAATWLVVLLPLPNWMDKITQERFALWMQVADQRSQMERARGQYLLALLSLHIDPKALDDIITGRSFERKSQQPSCAMLPREGPRAPLGAGSAAFSAASSAPSKVLSDEEKRERKISCCRELIETAAREPDVLEVIADRGKNRRLYNLLIANSCDSGVAIRQIHSNLADPKQRQDYVGRVKDRYDTIVEEGEASKSKLEGQKASFDVAIPGFLGVPVPGSVSAPTILCLWSLASLALIIYLVQKRSIALELCRDLLHQSPAATGVLLQRFWWWLLPLPRVQDDQNVRGFLGWQGRYRALLLANMAIVGSLLAAHAHVMFLAVRFREWAAYFKSIPPSADRVADSARFGFVPVVVLATLACGVTAVIYWWASLPDLASGSENPSRGRRRFVRLALFAPLVGAAVFAVQRGLWAHVGYETLRKWWRRPRYRRRQVLTPAPGLEPGFYVSEQGLKKKNKEELVLHYAWSPHQFGEQITEHLKSLLAQRRRERWPEDKSWATNQFMSSAASGNLSASDGFASLQLRHRKKRRPDPAPLNGSVIRKAHGIDVATLKPVTLDDKVLFHDVVKPQAGAGRLQSLEAHFHIQLATASHSLEQHALATLMTGGDPRQAIACVEMAVRLDRSYKARMNRPLSFRLYDLLVGLSLRFSETTMEDILERIERPDDTPFQQRVENTWRRPRWIKRWRNRKHPIRWAGVMLPPVKAHQIHDLPPLSPQFPAPSSSDKRP